SGGNCGSGVAVIGKFPKESTLKREWNFGSNRALYKCVGKGTKRIWIMNVTSHNPGGSARQAKPLANQLSHPPITWDDESSQISSAGQGREERDPGNSCSSRAFNAGCATQVHELANTTTAVLMNAQVLGWKLPPYSRLKRPPGPFRLSPAGVTGTSSIHCHAARCARFPAADVSIGT